MPLNRDQEAGTRTSVPIGTRTKRDSAARLREVAVAMLGYALGLARSGPLEPEQAARLLADAMYRQPPPQIRNRRELADQARNEASFLALLYGQVALEERDHVWTQSVSLAADQAALERFGCSLEWYARWMAALDNARQRGVRRQTRLEGRTLWRRIWLTTAATHEEQSIIEGGKTVADLAGVPTQRR